MAGQGSSRVTLREIDESQVRSQEQLPQGTPAAVVGTSKKGPAFVPQTFASKKQFEEIFGSLSDVSKDSNANQFGPLAINEWMKNSEAGTYVRVLGAGDGKAATANSVNSAGFTVGQQLVQADLSNPGKLGDNPYSTSNVQGKTYFLGCLMNDTTNSSLLKDSGVTSEEAQAQITIEFGDDPILSSSLKLVSVDGAGTPAERTYNFLASEIAGSGQVNRTDPATSLSNCIAAFQTDLTGSVSGNSITIQQINSGEAGNTLVTADINASVRNQINIIGSSTITNSKLDETIQFREVQGLAKDVGKIIAQSAAINGLNGIEVSAKESDGTGAAVTYQVIDEGTYAAAVLTLAAGIQDFATAQGFFYSENGICKVKSVSVAGNTNLENNKATLVKVKEAINKTSGFLKGGVSSSIKNLVTASINSSGELEIELVIAGSKVDGKPSVSVAGGLNVLFTAVNYAGGVASLDDLDSQITMTFSGQPAVGDNFTIPLGFNGIAVAQAFTFIANANGTLNGKGTLTGGTTGDVQIEIGDSVDITLDNIKDAIKKNTVNGSRFNETHADVVMNIEDKSIKIAAKGAGGLDNNLPLTTNMKNTVTFTNPAGDSLVGNFGEKTTSFSGGETLKAKPVIRGVLMTPQGVRPTLDPKNNLGGQVNFGTTGEDLRRVNVSSATFGGSAGSNLGGYILGKVTDQSFTLMLNGFTNEDQSAKLECSFDPDASNYFVKVLNTDPTRIEEYGHYLYANWDVEKEIAEPSNTALTFAHGTDLHAFCVPGASGAAIPSYEDFTSRYRTARSPWVVSQAFDGNESDRSGLSSDLCKKLFKLHALDDGEIGNKQYRVLVSNISLGKRGEYGSFNLSLESLSSDPVSGTAIAEWKNLSLDPDSKNFIGRVIGNHHTYWDFDREESRQRLVETGEFPVRNKFVRVEIHPDVTSKNIPVESLPTGFQGPGYLKTAITGNFVEPLSTPILPANTLSGAQVLPFPMVKSISRLVGNSKESSSRLPWGVKFGIKRGLDTEHKELTEQEYNKSLYSWMKFFPDIGSVPAFVEGEASNDTFHNNFFSLEKIHVVTGGSEKISSWDDAEYRRDGSAGTGDRFVVMNKDAKGTNVPYLKFRFFMQGGFDGVNIFDKEKAKLSNVATLREGLDEAANNSFTGPTINSYKKAIDTLKDKTTFEMQLLSIPGIRSSQVTDYAIQACEDRFDAMLVMDIEEYDDSADMNLIVSKSDKPSALNTVEKFSDRNLDTSFAAAYFPDVVSSKPSDGSSIVVPPSVVMLGAIGLNDRLADPWFAPAGLSRGRLNASDSRLRMPRSVLDQVYDADINPIYVPAGRSKEVFTFGQKTLLKDQSALDRINVRRLLINLRRKVRNVAERLLFEPNRVSTLEKFSQLVEPILAEVQQRRGVERYKVQIDTNTTTQNDIENNTIRGKIYVQPTKSVEFISLDFVVTNSINE